MIDDAELRQRGELEVTTSTPWRTMIGEIVTVATMADSHLLNCIRVLRGYSPKGTRWVGKPVRRREWLNVMANEAYRRGLRIDEVRAEDPVHE